MLQREHGCIAVDAAAIAFGSGCCRRHEGSHPVIRVNRFSRANAALPLSLLGPASKIRRRGVKLLLFLLTDPVQNSPKTLVIRGDKKARPHPLPRCVYIGLPAGPGGRRAARGICGVVPGLPGEGGGCQGGLVDAG